MAYGRLAGELVVVTGASSGIGRGIAKHIALEGAHVIAVGRSEDRLSLTTAAIAEAGGSAESMVCDVTSESDVRRLFSTVAGEHKRVTALVNNAGIVAPAPIDTMTLDEWQTVVDVNLTGPFLCTREVFGLMRRTGGGRILNIGSISATVPRPNSANYAAAKAGLVGLTRSTAIEGRPFGISAGCLHPGNVATEMRLGDEPEGALGWNSEPMMTVDQVAEAAVMMLTVEPGSTVWELTMLPIGQDYLGRG